MSASCPHCGVPWASHPTACSPKIGFYAAFPTLTAPPVFQADLLAAAAEREGLRQEARAILADGLDDTARILALIERVAR